MRSTRIFSFLMLLVATGIGVVLPGQAQNVGPATDYVTLKASATPGTVAPGRAVQVVLDTQIAEGWKMYAIDSPPPSRAVQVLLDDLPEEIVQAGELTQSAPKSGFDVNFDVDVSYFNQVARFEMLFAVAPEASAATSSGWASRGWRDCSSNSRCRST